MQAPSVVWLIARSLPHRRGVHGLGPSACLQMDVLAAILGCTGALAVVTAEYRWLTGPRLQAGGGPCPCWGRLQCPAFPRSQGGWMQSPVFLKMLAAA